MTPVHVAFSLSKTRHGFRFAFLNCAWDGSELKRPAAAVTVGANEEHNMALEHGDHASKRLLAFLVFPVLL